MAFDPFGDLETAGYLRNRVGKKDPQEVKVLEHATFAAQLPSTLDWIAGQPLTYDTLLAVHARLFGALYPWAGQDRMKTTPHKTVKKGSIVFADPEEIQDIAVMALHETAPGRVLGGLALAHPFLDGNGRAIFVFFAEHQRRQGRLVRFDQMSRSETGRALGEAINGDTHKLEHLLVQHTVKFPFRQPRTESLSKIMAAIDWSGTGQAVPYNQQPTFLRKLFSRTPKP